MFKNIFFVILSFLISSCTLKPQLDNPKSSSIFDFHNLSLREKVAQMIMVRVRGDYYHSNHWYRKSLNKWIANDGIGGVITFGGSVHGTFYNISNYQKWAKIPLLVSADYERGLGQWMRGGTLFPSNMALAASGDTSLAYLQGKITGVEAKAIGVHIAFSPVMDVNNNPSNPIINFRSYSDSPELVRDFGNSFINGLQSTGIYACAKHFPGHGNTNIDSHSSLPIINGTKNELESVELKPFKSAVKNGVKMIMVGHIAMPGLDSLNVPASFSKSITSNLLRKDWGFDGLIITDGMEMGGLTESTSAAEAAILAVEAGADILLLPMDVDNTINSLVLAVENGRLSEERINQSVERIWKAKTELNLFKESKPSWANVEKNIGIPQNTKIADKIAEKSITIVKDINREFPLRPQEIQKLNHLILSTDEGAPDMLKSFLSNVKNTHPNVEEIYVTQPISNIRAGEIIKKSKIADKTLVTLLVRIRMDKGISTIDSTHANLIEKLNQENINFVVVGFGSPYLPSYDYIDSYLCAYGYGKVSQVAAANVLWGRKKSVGKLPVDLSPELNRGSGVISLKSKHFNGYEQKYNLSSAWAIIDSAIDNKIFPGSQVFIAKNEKIIASRGFGYHTYDNNSPPVEINSIYDVASLTKVLVTTPLIMKLITQKKMGLNQSLDQFYPSISNTDKKNITIRHLLTHSSGFPAFIEFFKINPTPSEQEVIKLILKSKLDFNPGEEFQYSDLGMIILKDIIEKVTSRNFKKLANSWIIKPLQMNSTYFNPHDSLLYRIVPTEYDSVFRRVLIHGVVHDENAFLLDGVSGHAGLFSTAKDIGVYAQTMLNFGLFNGSRFFKNSAVKDFTEIQNIPEGSDRTLGWDTPSKNGKSSAGDLFSENTYGHLGFTGTSLWVDPDHEIIVVLLTNRVHPSRKRGGIYGIRREFHSAVVSSLID